MTRQHTNHHLRSRIHTSESSQDVEEYQPIGRYRHGVSILGALQQQRGTPVKDTATTVITKDLSTASHHHKQRCL
jgi:hypothetical protein